MTTGLNTNQPRSALHLPLLVTAMIDATMIVLFATGGRESHSKELTVLGVLDTAWPFLAGAAVGWSLMYVYAHVRSPDWFGAHTFRPERAVPFGVVVWVFAVAVGMALRIVGDKGTAAPFIGVATLTLFVLLIGWRTVANRLHRLFARR